MIEPHTILRGLRSPCSKRLLVVPFAVALLWIGPGACGSTGKDVSTGHGASSNVSARAITARSGVVRLPIDRDGDNDNPTKSHYDRDDASVLQIGRAPDGVEAAAIVELVKRYYTVAAAGDGVAACSLLYSSISETVVEDYGRLPGQPQLHGKTCAEVMSKLFEQHRLELSDKSAKLEVTHMRVYGDQGVVLLRFSTGVPERRVLIQRESGTWRMGLLLDVAVP